MFTAIQTFTTSLRLEDETSLLITSDFSIAPNPCSFCEVTGIDNSNDLLVTDLLGRCCKLSFTKSTNGYYINLPQYENGIFLIRNIKTGQVVKFVKE